MEARLSVAKCQLDRVPAAGPLTLWPLLFLAPLPPGGLRAVTVTSAQPLAAYADKPLVNKSEARDVLVPVEPNAGVVALEPAFDPVARLTGWCIGAAGLLLPGNRAGSKRRSAKPPAAVRYALEDFRRRLMVELSASLHEQVTAPAKGDGGKQFPGDRAPEPPRSGTALERLVSGPAHRVINAIVSDDSLRREDALTIIRDVRRLATDPLFFIPDEPKRSGQPRRLRRQRRHGEKDVVPSVIQASILSAHLVWPRDETLEFKLETPLLDGAGKKIGSLDGEYEVVVSAETKRAMS